MQKQPPGERSNPRQPPGEKVAAAGETPDSYAWAFMAGEWSLTFRCAPAQHPARPSAGYGSSRELPAPPPAPFPQPGAGARFTYGVYLQESLEVPDAVDLTSSQPLDQLSGYLGFLQADHTVRTRPGVPARPQGPRSPARTPPSSRTRGSGGARWDPPSPPPHSCLSDLGKKKNHPNTALTCSDKKAPAIWPSPGCPGAVRGPKSFWFNR